MKILIAVSVAQRRHVFHPEMIGESPDLVDSLFEAELDFEAQAIEANDLSGAEREIGTHQDARAAGGMNNHNEADDTTNRAPEQIMNGKVQSDIAFAIDGTGELLHGFGVAQEGAEFYFLAVACRTTPLPLSLDGFGLSIGDGIGLDPGYQVMAIFE